MSTRTAVIRGISYQLGELHPVDAMLAKDITVEMVNELLERGVISFSVFEKSLVDALKACTTVSLASARLDAADIDTVIVVTESFGDLFDSRELTPLQNQTVPRIGRDHFREIRNQTYDLIYSLGIRKASISCATYGGCANLLQAMVLAKTLVVQGLGKNVLVIAAERFPSLESRLLKEAVSLGGDGVATCIVNSDETSAPGAFQLDYVSIAPYKNLEPNADMASMLLQMFRAMKNAAADCYEACNREPRDFKWLILGDYNRQSSQTYGKLLGFPPERTFLENVGKLGHIPFDSLINLADLSRTSTIEPSDPILLFLCGPVSCGALAVQAI